MRFGDGSSECWPEFLPFLLPPLFLSFPLPFLVSEYVSISSKTALETNLKPKIRQFSRKTPDRAKWCQPGRFHCPRAFLMLKTPDPGVFAGFDCFAQPSSNGHNFFIRAPIEACNIPTRSYFKDKDNGCKIKEFGHHLDRQRTVSIRPYSTCTSIN